MMGKLKRLARSFFVSQARPDDVWAHQRLFPAEYGVYASMDPRDREHGVRVAQKLEQDYPGARAELIAAAILHDCGKSVRKYNVLERVLVGLIPYRLSALWTLEAVKVRNEHPTRGAEMVRLAGGREDVAHLIERHHDPRADLEAGLLHDYDTLE
jgi:putative nucleotidyltransferase with HDIG domain